MKVSLIQMNSGPDKAANLAAAERHRSTAAVRGRGARLDLPARVLRPSRRHARGQARGGRDARRRARLERRWQRLARTHGVFIHAGSMLERIPGDARLHNTTLVFDRAGSEVARYRKIHMFDIT